MKNLVRLFARGPKAEQSFGALGEQARRAEDEWRLDDALTLWAEARDRHPGRAAGYAGHATVLAKLNRCEEAIAELDLALARFPRVATMAIDRARITHDFGAYEKALALSRDLVVRFPGDPHGPEMVAKCLRSLLRFAEADAVLREARLRFPRHIGHAVEYVACADMRGDYAEGLARSATLLQDFPDAPIAHASRGAALKRLKRYDEADAVLAAAVARFPDNSNLAVNHAWVADDRGDWQEALRRWTAAHERFGREPRIRSGLMESQGRANLARLDAAADPAGAGAPPAAMLPPGAAAPDAALFTRFESLGENCEFGFVQRHFGAEPLGLLRWAGIAYDKVLAGLDSAFDGVGGPERTRMRVNPNNQEYVVSDTFYGFDMHTFILKDDSNEAATYRKMGRRLEYLKDKLLDDLATAEKVFVFQSAQDLSDGDLLRLHQALRRHGPGRLLAVRPARPGQAPGAVVPLAEGLAAGFIDRVGFIDNHWTISFGLWRQLCLSALALFEPDGPPAA